MLSQIFKDASFKVIKTKLLYDEGGKSKCAGFVDFENTETAAKAVTSCHGTQQGSKRIVVQIAKQ